MARSSRPSPSQPSLSLPGLPLYTPPLAKDDAGAAEPRFHLQRQGSDKDPLSWSAALRTVDFELATQPKTPLPEPPRPRGQSWHKLTRSTTERAVSSVPPPASDKLSTSKVWVKKNVPDTSAIASHFSAEGRLHPADAIELARCAAILFRSEPNLLKLSVPAVVVGDVHGQYYDLRRLMLIGGDPATSCYLFLGDYVDRGLFSCEVILFLFSLKIRYPSSIFLLRGNHECRHINAFFSFKAECMHKYGEQVFDAIEGVFDTLPLAALLEDRHGRRYFCTHGGISPHLRYVDDINEVDRFREVPSNGCLMQDILWSDPTDNYNTGPMESPSLDPDDFFIFNSQRGCAWQYSFLAVRDFLRDNGLSAVIRGHEVQQRGHQLYRAWDVTQLPTVISLFSAPDYFSVGPIRGTPIPSPVPAQTEEEKPNLGAVMLLSGDGGHISIKTFKESAEPYYLPRSPEGDLRDVKWQEDVPWFRDCFTWSAPFIWEKVAEMLRDVLSAAEEELSDDEHPSFVESPPSAPLITEEERLEREAVLSRRRVIRSKILAAAKLARMLSVMRSNREMLMLLRSDGRLPSGVLQEGRRGVLKAVRSFAIARKTDRVNLAIPPLSAGDQKKANQGRTGAIEKYVQYLSDSGSKLITASPPLSPPVHVMEEWGEEE